MNITSSRIHVQTSANGVIEVLIVMATLGLLVIIALTGISTRSWRQSPRIRCANNLKQVGLAARMWSADNGDVFPWNAPISSNGVKELALSGNVAALFGSMTNELMTAKMLACPSDRKRSTETNFLKLANGNISYFIGLDADETKPQTILSGDRNISGGILMSNRVMEVRVTNVLVWGTDIHKRAGNIGLGDGSVFQASNPGLQRQVIAHHRSFTQQTAVARFAVP